MSRDKSKAENIEDVRNKLKNHELRLVNMWFNVQASNVALGALRITLYDLEKKFHQFKRETKMTKLAIGAKRRLKPKVPKATISKSRKLPESSKTKATEEKIDTKANKILKGKKK